MRYGNTFVGVSEVLHALITEGPLVPLHPEWAKELALLSKWADASNARLRWSLQPKAKETLP